MAHKNFEPTEQDLQTVLDGKVTLDFVIDFCQRANETAWLKEVANRTVQKKVYPKVMGTNGRMVQDKSQTPTMVETKISFMEIRELFLIEFFGKSPKKEKKSVTMRDRIAAL